MRCKMSNFTLLETPFWNIPPVGVINEVRLGSKLVRSYPWTAMARVTKRVTTIFGRRSVAIRLPSELMS